MSGLVDVIREKLQHRPGARVRITFDVENDHRVMVFARLLAHIGAIPLETLERFGISGDDIDHLYYVADTLCQRGEGPIAKWKITPRQSGAR